MPVIKEIDLALAAIRGGQPRIKLYRDYFRGNHRLAFATAKYLTTFGFLFREFADNVCSGVINTLADKLIIDGMGNTATGQRAWELWQDLKLQRRAGQIHQEALLCGDSYLIIWPAEDAKTPMFHVNKSEHIYIRYAQDDPTLIDCAAKMWLETNGAIRLTLYYADRIEKYTTAPKASSTATSRAFAPLEVDGEAWPLPNPYGRVPVFHFANNAFPGELGQSELADVIPLQDAINKTATDLMVAMEYVALPQRYAIGLGVRRDPDTGKPIPPFDPGVDRIWSVEDEDVQFGQFDPANLVQFLSVKEAFTVDVARVSRTPLHNIMPQNGNPPSGEALRTASEPLTNKAEDRADGFGETWAQAMAFAILIADGGNPDPGEIHPEWRDPAPSSKKEDAETGEIKTRIGVPAARVMVDDLHYSEDEVTKMLEDEAARQQQAQQAAILTMRVAQAAATAVGAVPGQTIPAAPTSPPGATGLGDTRPQGAASNATAMDGTELV